MWFSLRHHCNNSSSRTNNLAQPFANSKRMSTICQSSWPQTWTLTRIRSVSVSHAHKHTHITKNCTFLTTHINWDFTDPAAGFQLASHNYVPCLPLHPLPLLSLMLTLSHTHSTTAGGGSSWECMKEWETNGGPGMRKSMANWLSEGSSVGDIQWEWR